MQLRLDRNVGLLVFFYISGRENSSSYNEGNIYLEEIKI